MSFECRYGMMDLSEEETVSVCNYYYTSTTEKEGKEETTSRAKPASAAKRKKQKLEDKLRKLRKIHADDKEDEGEEKPAATESGLQRSGSIELPAEALERMPRMDSSYAPDLSASDGDSNSTTESDSDSNESDWSDDLSSDEEHEGQQANFVWRDGSLLSRSSVMALESIKLKKAAVGEIAGAGSPHQRMLRKGSRLKEDVTHIFRSENIKEGGSEKEKGKEKDTIVVDTDDSEEEYEGEEGSLDEDDEEVAYTEWNVRFQRLLAMQNETKQYAGLEALENEFLAEASLYGRIIISELFVPPSEKTIPAADVGGIAGGQKYIFHGIFFKLAHDFEIVPGRWMYGGPKQSDEKAIKATGHDLKSLVQFYNAKVTGINVPLTCTVDYNGFRLLCCSVLPLGKETLRYGSNDGGKTVLRDEEPKLRRKIKRVCKWLNLRKHMVATGLYHWGPGDLEGHRGRDRKFYVVDMARLFPPEAPGQGEDSRCIFYNMLRPELVRKKKHLPPLNPDAFSMWGKADPQAKEHNKDVVQATLYMHQQLIPKVAAKLETTIKQLGSKKTAMGLPASKVNLSNFLHRKGVNIRHLGRVRWHMKDPLARQALLDEMVARVFKNELRHQLRETMKQEGSRSRVGLNHSLFVNFLNTFLRNPGGRLGGHMGDRRPTAWLEFVKTRLEEKFGIEVGEDDEKILLGMPLLPPLTRFCEKMEITISDRVLMALAQAEGLVVEISWFTSTAIKPLPIILASDVIRVGTVVKHMNITTLASAVGVFYNAEELSETNAEEARSLLESASAMFDSVMASGLNDISIRLKAATVHRKLAILARDKNPLLQTPLYRGISNESTQTLFKHYQLAVSGLQKCFAIVGNSDPKLLGTLHVEYGLTLLEALKIKEAVENIVKGLKLNHRQLSYLLKCSNGPPQLRESVLKQINILRAILIVFPDHVESLASLARKLATYLSKDITTNQMLTVGTDQEGVEPIDAVVNEAAAALERALSLDEDCLGDYGQNLMWRLEGDTRVANPRLPMAALVAHRSPLFKKYLIKELMNTTTLWPGRISWGTVDRAPDTAEALMSLFPGVKTLNFTSAAGLIARDIVCERMATTCTELTALVELNVSREHTLDWLPKLSHLSTLGLNRVETEPQLSNIAALSQLSTLGLGELEIGSPHLDMVFERLSSLTSLSLASGSSSVVLSDDAARTIGSQYGQNLTFLDLSLAMTQGTNLALIFPQLKALKTLILSDLGSYETTSIRTTDFEEIPSTIKNLRLRNLVARASFEPEWANDLNIILEIIAKRCTRMKRLALDNVPISDTGLEAIMRNMGSTLRVLHFRQCRNITDSGLIHFSHATKLSHLRFDQSPLSPEGLQHLSKYVTTLQGLDIHPAPPALEPLSALVHCNNLRQLRISTAFSGQDTISFLSNFPSSLRSVSFSTSRGVSDAALKTLTLTCPRLQNLVLDVNSTSDFGMRYFVQNLPKLRQLVLLYSDKITALGLATLKDAPKLKRIIHSGRLTPRDKRELDELMPGVEILTAAASDSDLTFSIDSFSWAQVQMPDYP